ncbi:Transcriptional regulator [Collimonas arenae]|uniref:Transcriptional regulator n=1 Tax=Collimonas arenae TaxID=279058 RepID=A0A0A1FD25_9BURK|nr:PLP-dependent aminotransferase family protein [Collimonas arenae]AIY42653.1 Transcriptional regulator [Collimonas arenae]
MRKSPLSLSPSQSVTPQLLYRQLAGHYLAAIQSNTLAPGERMPSVRDLMQQHQVSLSTALQALRYLEQDGWLEARPRSGYFVLPARRMALAEEPNLSTMPALMSAQYAGIHERVSGVIAQGHGASVTLDLSGASCAPELYAVEALKNAAIRTLRKQPQVLTSMMSHRGNPAFRQVLAKRSLAIGIKMAPEEVIVTHGCIEGINLALRAVAQAGDTVAVESPTYYGLLQVLESLGMRALEIPTSPRTGISIEALQLASQTYPDIKALVLVPNLQNPLGSIMPDEHKAQLVALCQEHGMALIEDDSYSGLVPETSSARALKSWDRSGNVIYCASLNKVLAPGMRLGWMAGGRWQARLEMLKFAHTRANEEWSQIAAADFMASAAYERHLRRLRDALRLQRARTADAIARHFPVGTRINVPDGGALLWVELPAQLSSKAVFESALKEGIKIAPGLMFSNSNRFNHFLRLSCGQPFSPRIEYGIKRLGEIVEDLLAGRVRVA